MNEKDSSSSVSRREVLTAGTGWFLLGACGPRSSDPGGPFPLGVASGDVTDSQALLWTRYVGNRELELTLWKGAPEEGEKLWTRTVVPGEHGVVLVDLDGLEPNTRYSYVFFERGSGGGGATNVGRFRTALPAGSRQPVLFGASCCTKNGHDFSALERAGTRSDLDLFLLLGDTVYADGARTLEEYRDKWTENLSTPAYLSLRASTSIVATYDDHEVYNNWAGERADSKRLEYARKTLYEHLPIRRPTEAPDRLWRSFRWGETVEFFVLDCRTERRPSTRGNLDAEYVSPAQLAWLEQGLANSPCAFKVIVNSVPIATFGGVFQTSVQDRWEGYPAQRERLLRFIDDRSIRGVLWIAGDFHLACMGRVSQSGPGANAIEVLVGPAANTANASPFYPGKPQWDWSSGTNNYTTFALEPATREVTIQYHDKNDRMIARKVYAL